MAQTGSGTIDYLTQRVLLAKDSPGVVGLATANVTLGSILNEVASQDITFASLYITQGSIYDEVQSIDIALGSIDTTLGSILTEEINENVSLGSIVGAVESMDVTIASLFVAQGSIYDETQSIDIALASLSITQGSILTAVESVDAAVTPSLYNISLITADTEYEQAFPSNTKQFEFRLRGDYDIRFAYEMLKVATPTAPYRTLEAKQTKFQQQLNAAATLYVACATAGQIVELEVWV